jgi:aminopeptidase N
MMMWDRETGDQNFKATMQDFMRTYAGRAATTEDFKAVVEKQITPEMTAFGGGTIFSMNTFMGRRYRATTSNLLSITMSAAMWCLVSS